jgi:hypothetical protein
MVLCAHRCCWSHFALCILSQKQFILSVVVGWNLIRKWCSLFSQPHLIEWSQRVSVIFKSTWIKSGHSTFVTVCTNSPVGQVKVERNVLKFCAVSCVQKLSLQFAGEISMVILKCVRPSVWNGYRLTVHFFYPTVVLCVWHVTLLISEDI